MLRVVAEIVGGSQALRVERSCHPVAVNDEVPTRIGGWFTGESIAEPAAGPCWVDAAAGLKLKRSLSYGVPWRPSPRPRANRDWLDPHEASSSGRRIRARSPSPR